MSPSEPLSQLIAYLCNCEVNNGKIPSIAEMSLALGTSVATLREQLEAARALGFLESKPRTGIRLLPYSLKPAILNSVSYALEIDPANFLHFSDLRTQIENSYWNQAVIRLTKEDHGELLDILERATRKLNGNPVQIPHLEHRSLHLTIFKRLENPFVTGILEAYWDLYEISGLAVYSDLEYLTRVWDYHRKMVQAITSGEFWIGQNALRDHMDLLFHREKIKPQILFE